MSPIRSPEQEPVRVLHVVGGMNRGGVETWLMHVLRSIDRTRFRMDFLVHTEEPCAYDDEIRRLGSSIFPCMRPSRPWLYGQRFKRILRDHGPYDVVHSHVYLFSGFVLRLAREMHVPTRIAHIHPAIDMKTNQSLRSLYTSMMKGFISRNATDILANSHHTVKCFFDNGFSGPAPQVIYPLTVDPSRFARGFDRDAVRRKHGIPVDRPAVIYVARFSPHKNHAQVVRVADGLRSRGVRACHVMVGSHGPLLDHFRRLATERDDLRVLSQVDDVTDVLRSCDLFFFPSLNEGFGIVATEAAWAGLPIVSTNLPTLREAVPPAYHEFMFEPDDDLAAIANIQAILENETMRASAISQARGWLQSMSAQSSIDKLTPHYRAGRAS